MVEDHPYDYKDFEGNIPEGNYGGGNVIVWDHGTYHLPEPADKKIDEKTFLAALQKGHLNFILKGKKLKGEFSLVKIKNGKQENAWLLIKKSDKYSSDEDVTQKNKSVISKVTLEQLAKKYRNEKNGAPTSTKRKKKVVSENKKPSVKKKAA